MKLNRFRNAILVLLLGWLAGCEKPNHESAIKFILPDGYRGVFSVTFEANLPPSEKSSSRQMLIEIPRTGDVAIANPFSTNAGNHLIAARYLSSREVLPMVNDIDSSGLRLVSFDEDKTNHTRTSIWLIGTQADVNAIRSRRLGAAKLK